MKPMTKAPIAEQIWEVTTINQVVHSFLKGEFHNSINALGEHAKSNIGIINNPNFDNESENCMRSMMLFFRFPIISKIPLSTVWHKVNYLSNNHINELLVIGRCGWDSHQDNNEVFNVSKRMANSLTSSPSEWNTPILWGHTKNGPFTIIEGNHRFVAVAPSGKEFSIPCYIGLSPDNCCWHLPDS